MDWNWIIGELKKDIKKECPQLTDEIINEFIYLTFWGANWATYGNNKEIYILGLAETKYDFYYVGCNEKYEIQLISCALEVKKNKERGLDFITIINKDVKLWSKESDDNWRIIRKNIKEYFGNHQNEKLIYFQDHILQDEHIVYDNEDKTKYHIEKIKN